MCANQFVRPGSAGNRAEGLVKTYELEAAGLAVERGVTYLLVPTIERWDQNCTDDPIGAFITPKNRIAISLRLMRLDNPAIVGRVSFTSHSRITLNSPRRTSSMKASTRRCAPC